MFDKTLADALCTTIAMGFISLNHRMGSKTQFIYEDDEEGHVALATLLVAYGLDVSVISNEEATKGDKLPLPKTSNPILIEHQTDKEKQPLIFARERGRLAEYEKITESMQHLTEAIERQVARDFGDEAKTLFGAYIGAKLEADTGQLKLYTPSNLYVRPRPDYVASNNDVREAFARAKNVRDRLVAHIGSYHMKEFGGFRLREFVYSKPLMPIPDTVRPEELFASCHGLVSAVFDIPILNGEFHVEYALGKATCKVASCLPCSIFASAINARAHATHFGKGDNWNFPKDSQPKDDKRICWQRMVKECYNEGFKLMDSRVRRVNNLKLWIETNEKNEAIPDLFLDALTFEDSFSKRIKVTLS